MKQTEQITKLREELINLKENNQISVNVDDLLDYIDYSNKQIPNEKKDNLLKERLQHQSNISIEMLKSVIQSGQNAMKTALFINAGAAISMLTLISNLIGKNEKIYVNALSTPLLIFVLGVLFSACAYGTTYFTQAFYSNQKITKGNISNAISIILTVTSLSAFTIASYCIYTVLIKI
ncbi:hypothetical protein CRV01_06240 [Arcobacter sp. CECT 8983]|uniref:hypothetical protein n=1 Tax=Arcobacter sp. CECT 8983 TaxID=2044508 RepID=UPI00100B360D|nr:hypothetical protein [Arcobacter sp. CECT 8983]RXJ90746.1 hypothetical protein CRV01_06240 [Arcobacter sp. CECT 8983]